MKKLLPFLFTLMLFAACQKEETKVLPASDDALKTSNLSAYGRLRNTIIKRADLETYCGTDYVYTETIYIDGKEWQYDTTGYEYLMYKGLTHFADANNDYMFCGLEYPSDGYVYGIGLGNKVLSAGKYSFTANVQISIPEKKYTAIFNNAPCFALGDESLTSTDSIRIVLHSKQNHNPVFVADSIITFDEMKDKLGITLLTSDSVVLYSSLGKVADFSHADIYNWDFYGGGTTDMYGLENAGKMSHNLNFGDALIGNCSGNIDIYLHDGTLLYKCSTLYSIFYTDYLGAGKQLHIYR